MCPVNVVPLVVDLKLQLTELMYLPCLHNLLWRNLVAHLLGICKHHRLQHLSEGVGVTGAEECQKTTDCHALNDSLDHSSYSAAFVVLIVLLLVDNLFIASGEINWWLENTQGVRFSQLALCIPRSSADNFSFGFGLELPIKLGSMFL